MQPHAQQHQTRQMIQLFVSLILLAGVWWVVEKRYFPKPPPREALGAVVGAAPTQVKPGSDWKQLGHPDPEPAAKKPEPTPEVKAPQPQPVGPKAPAVATEPPELFALGDDDFSKSVLMTSRGGAVQQVTLRHFDEANRIGVEVRTPDGKPQPLRIIPGILRPRTKESLTVEAPFPTLTQGKVTDPEIASRLSEPSYVLLHYPSIDDPRRTDETEKGADKYPLPDLGLIDWKVVAHERPQDAPHKIVFETELGTPYFLKIRKTYTLARREYHLTLSLDFEPLPGRVKDKGKFRYQLCGPRGTLVEGEWYTQTYRSALVGWNSERGSAKRTIEDATTIHTKWGGDVVPQPAEGSFTYAAIGTQYFASALAIDDSLTSEARRAVWDYVRPTREPSVWDDPAQNFLGDITFRAVSKPIDLAPPTTGKETVTHKYMIYDGPLKVRLLKQLGVFDPAKKVDDELVDRYLDKLTLRSLTDHHSPNFFGRFANMIWWSELVITFTNLMHGILGLLHSVGLPWGVCIILLTVLVRLALMVPSRKQQATMAKMQEKMAKMKPELDKLQERFKDDPQGFQQEKARLMLRHGVNPLSTMGGCLLLFAQMPIFTGLYFCLQESVFFRLEPFLWFPNLAAPDMLVWWRESIPFLTSLEALGGSLYLGPYLNILPIISVTLIFIQQKISMPPATNEQEEFQQKMMKFMVVVMALFFYKVASGLCMYFIISTAWALAERKLLKKPTDAKESTPIENVKTSSASADPPAKSGGFFQRLKDKVEELQKQADEQARRQIRNDSPTTPPQTPRKDEGQRDKKRKRKK